MHMPDIGSRILFCMINLSGPLSFQRLTRLWGWKIVNNWMFHLFIGHKNSSTYVLFNELGRLCVTAVLQNNLGVPRLLELASGIEIHQHLCGYQYAQIYHVKLMAA
jgi:hypothetical protein